MGNCNDLLNLLVDETVKRALLSGECTIKTREQFENLCKSANAQLQGLANHLSENVKNILNEFHAVKKLLKD